MLWKQFLYVSRRVRKCKGLLRNLSKGSECLPCVPLSSAGCASHSCKDGKTFTELQRRGNICWEELLWACIGVPGSPPRSAVLYLQRKLLQNRGAMASSLWPSHPGCRNPAPLPTRGFKECSTALALGKSIWSFASLFIFFLFCLWYPLRQVGKLWLQALPPNSLPNSQIAKFQMPELYLLLSSAVASSMGGFFLIIFLLFFFF